MPRVICPFCVRIHDFQSDQRCPDTKLVVPKKYIDNYVEIRPLWLMTIGFSGVGKSSYLSMLTLTLERASDILDGMWYMSLDGFTFQTVKRMHGEVAQFKSPTPTDKNERSRPMLFQVNGMPGAPPRCLMLYDIAGETFDDFESINDLSPALRQVNTAWFMVSLSDMEQGSAPRRLSDLFMVYLEGLEKYNVDITGWNLIVVYTKADSHSFGAEIDNYILSDPLKGLDQIYSEDERNAINLKLTSGEYLADMKGVSDLLRQYTCEKTNGGRAFVHMAEANEMNLTFCVTSSLGSDPKTGGRYDHKPIPHRVFDPLLWSLQLEKPPVEIPVALVADASESGEEIFNEAILGRIWDALSDETTVTTYSLGRDRPVAEASQVPPKALSTCHKPRLIGPILESAQPGQRFVVLATGPILDLGEFQSESWRRRLLLVKVDSDYSSAWSNQHIYSRNDDPRSIVEAVKRMN